MKVQYALTVTLALAALVVPGAVTHSAAAEQATELRIATLAPSGSSWMKVFNAWNLTIQKETNETLKLRFYAGGSQGDERDFVRKMRAGQVDGASITTTGLGQLVRQVLVLSVPGVFNEYEELDRVRAALNERFEGMFDQEGYRLLGWGDVGKTRLFSTERIERPSDIKKLRPWAWKDDLIFTEFLKIVGANPIRLGVPEVYPALQTGMVDVVPSSAIGAVALQWFTKLKYMSSDSFGIVLGATMIKTEKLEELPPEDQKVLRNTAKRAALALDKVVRHDDARAYEVMVERGIEVVDTHPYRSEWEAAGKETRERLIGRIYSQSLLDEVQAAAGSK